MFAHKTRIFYNHLYYHRKKIYPLTYGFFKFNSFHNINKTLVEKYISNLENEYKNIVDRKISDVNTENRVKQLNPIMHIINEKNRITEHYASLKELLEDNDAEMKKLAEEERQIYENKLALIEEELLESLIPIDSRELCDSIVLEINAGVGGQEAMLFAHELFDMYLNFAEYKGWSIEVAELDSTDMGGLRHASVFISGKEAFRYFKHEAGVHRVQRIPTTERAGRVHTSTVSIVALPQPRDIDINIQEKDLRIETKRASGAGGQHVNTTDSAVRIVHIPTGVAVDCQVDRSQIKNREIALQKLKALLYEQEMNEQLAESEATRKLQVRSNDRNEKIRTYNYSQDRITDHRLQHSNLHNLKGFLVGGQQLEALIDKLQEKYQLEKLVSLLNSIK